MITYYAATTQMVYNHWAGFGLISFIRGPDILSNSRASLGCTMEQANIETCSVEQWL